MRHRQKPRHGAIIREYIRDRGYQNLQICEKSGIPPGRFSKILHDVVLMSLDDYEAICAALNVPLGTFLTDRR